MNEKGDNIDNAKTNSYPSILNNLNFNNISLLDTTAITDEPTIGFQQNILDMTSTNLNQSKLNMNESLANIFGTIEPNIEQKVQELQNVIVLQKKNIEQLRKSEKINLSEIAKLKKKSKKAITIVRNEVEEINTKHNHEKIELQRK